MTISSFNDLGVIAPISQIFAKNNYNTPTPIQLNALPVLLKNQDLLGIAQTDTGKTAAFAIPLLQHLFQNKLLKSVENYVTKFNLPKEC
jgi:ATP-dependent RNA helicase RhlE